MSLLKDCELSRRRCAALFDWRRMWHSGLCELQLRLTAVHSESQEDLLLWQRCGPGLRGMKGKEECILQKPCLKTIPNGHWHYYIFTYYWHVRFTASSLLTRHILREFLPLTCILFWRHHAHGRKAQTVLSDLITCRTIAVDLITKPMETTTRLLMGDVWVHEDK